MRERSRRSFTCLAKLSGQLVVGSNKTIVGLSGASVDGPTGVVRLTDSSNVIIKNLTLIGRPTGKNANTVLHNSQNVWLDHIDFVDGMSDLLRFTGSSDFIAVSWSEFRHTVFGPEHMGVNIGFRDNDPASVGKMSITLHHNFYSELVNERMPRVRFGKVHTFNNLLLAGTENVAYYAVRAGIDANVRSERNIYQGFTGASWFEGAASSFFNYGGGNANSVLQSIEDSFVNCAERVRRKSSAHGR
ncbi:hypothetical protein [Sorangium sp. So ce341]|uniref:pectate lyase family protein n=1 Tax=Sorangium sp. So ce341 TaxID=3133302 RepID=UPI003F5FF0B9